MKTNRKQKTLKWFIKIRGSYLPNSREGWLTYIPFIAFLIAVPLIAVVCTDNTALAILFIIPNWIAAGVVMTYVGSQKS